MNWIYYHEVMSEFSLRHWAQTDERHGICKEGPLARSRQTVSDWSSTVQTHLTQPPQQRARLVLIDATRLSVRLVAQSMC